MRKQIYEIDEYGYIKEIHVGLFDDKMNLIKPVGEFVTVDIPQPLPFYKPKWNGTEWIEGESKEEKEERESLIFLESLKPTDEEIRESEFEIRMITLLIEMELI